MVDPKPVEFFGVKLRDDIDNYKLKILKNEFNEMTNISTINIEAKEPMIDMINYTVMYSCENSKIISIGGDNSFENSFEEAYEQIAEFNRRLEYLHKEGYDLYATKDILVKEVDAKITYHYFIVPKDSLVVPFTIASIFKLAETMPVTLVDIFAENQATQEGEECYLVAFQVRDMDYIYHDDFKELEGQKFEKVINEGVMNKGIELCGIKLGDTFNENNFIIQNKQVIPGGDYMTTVANPSSVHNNYFTNVDVIHSIGSKEIGMIIANNGGGYSRKDCVDIINQINDDYIDRYFDHYDMFVQEMDSKLSYLYYFYPPNYNVISFDDPKSSALKENVTCLMLLAINEEFETHFTLEASLFHYVDADDDKFPEEFDDAKLEKPLLKVVGLR